MENVSNLLADFALAIRQSSLKRLRRVPPGLENWRVDELAMSFADVAQHLIDADEWLLQKLLRPTLEPMVGRPHCFHARNREEYISLLRELENSGKRRGARLSLMNDDDLAVRIPDSRFGDEVSAWWVIVRGNLDHEIHHRGQIIAYLRMNGVHEPGRDRLKE